MKNNNNNNNNNSLFWIIRSEIQMIPSTTVIVVFG